MTVTFSENGFQKMLKAAAALSELCRAVLDLIVKYNTIRHTGLLPKLSSRLSFQHCEKVVFLTAHQHIKDHFVPLRNYRKMTRFVEQSITRNAEFRSSHYRYISTTNATLRPFMITKISPVRDCGRLQMDGHLTHAIRSTKKDNDD